MKPIVVAGIAGSNQAIDPFDLPANVGVNVVDCEPGRRQARPLKVRASVAGVPASPQRLSIWRMGRDVVDDANYWLSSSSIVNWTTGFGTDTTERTYYTGEATPRWTNNIIGLGGGPPYPQAFRELSVPAPSSAPSVALNADGTGTSANRYYVSTFVNDQGWESAPSAASAALFVKPGANITVSGLPAAPAGAYGITLRRIYRTQPEDASKDVADFFFLAEIAVGTASFVDNGQVLAGLLPTFDPNAIGSSWQPPPADGFGLAALWDSMYAMLSGKQVLFSEPSAPYAWPLRFRREVKDKPVAIGVWQQNAIVLTVGRAVLFQGADPASMQDTLMDTAWPCRSARGVVSFDYGVVWPSNEGLACTWSKGLLTDEILTPDQWKALNPNTMIAGRWQRFYVCAFNDGTSRGFMFDPMNPKDGIWYLSTGFDACHYDPLADQLYVLEGANVRKFNAGPGRLTGTFTAKRFLQTVPSNYGWAQVQADAYPITLKVTARWTDPSTGAAMSDVQTRSVVSSMPFGLKTGILADDVQPEVASAVNWTVVRLARDAHDLE